LRRGRVELDSRLIVVPLELVETPLGPGEPLADLTLVRHAEHLKRRAAHEHEFTAVAQEPRRLWDPLRGVAPDGGAVFREGEVERLARQARVFRGGLDDPGAEAVPLVHAPCGLELPRRDVDPDASRGARPLQPGAEVAGAA